jgi:flagellar hook assembly protein FlgD
MGQPVRVLVDGIQAMGRQTIDWDGLDSAGEQVPGGVYIYRMQAGEFAALRKMTVLK